MFNNRYNRFFKNVLTKGFDVLTSEFDKGILHAPPVDPNIQACHQMCPTSEKLRKRVKKITGLSCSKLCDKDPTWRSNIVNLWDKKLQTFSKGF